MPPPSTTRRTPEAGGLFAPSRTGLEHRRIGPGKGLEAVAVASTGVALAQLYGQEGLPAHGLDDPGSVGRRRGKTLAVGGSEDEPLTADREHGGADGPPFRRAERDVLWRLDP